MCRLYFRPVHADDERMSTPGYRVTELTQRWSLIGGRWYRLAAAVRLSDGALRLIGVDPDAVTA